MALREARGAMRDIPRIILEGVAAKSCPPWRLISDRLAGGLSMSEAIRWRGSVAVLRL